MKLYINEENEVLLNYSDVDFKAGTKKFTEEDFDREQYDICRNYEEFIRESNCEWISTLKPKVKQMKTNVYEWDSPYGKTYKLLRELEQLYNMARQSDYIEIGAGFKKYIEEIRQRTEKLYRIEREKEAERKRQETWMQVCKSGCGICVNKCRSGDDYICRATGELLSEKNMPANAGRVYKLFNFTPFPTENCPLNVEKQKEQKDVV